MSSGRVYEKVRQLIVHILKEHKLTNNFKTNITSTQQPSFTYNTTAVFRISKPKVDDFSISGKLKTAKNYAATLGSVSQEIFPQRVMGALADLYIVLFALYEEEIPNPKDNPNLINALNPDKLADTATGDGTKTSIFTDELLSQMFTTLLLKKKETHKHYKDQFEKLNEANPDDTVNAKKFLQAQILHIIETVGEKPVVEKPVVENTKENGGMRKTRKSKSKIGSRRRNKKSPGHKKSKKHRRKSYRNRRR